LETKEEKKKDTGRGVKFTRGRTQGKKKGNAEELHHTFKTTGRDVPKASGNTRQRDRQCEAGERGSATKGVGRNINERQEETQRRESKLGIGTWKHLLPRADVYRGVSKQKKRKGDTVNQKQGQTGEAGGSPRRIKDKKGNHNAIS